MARVRRGADIPPAAPPISGVFSDYYSTKAVKFEVVTRFEPGEAGPLGFVFQMTTLYDGTSMLRVTKLSGRAAACPHACVDMLLAGVQVAEEARKDVTRMSEEEVLTLKGEERRPLTLFFQHPWEVHPDGKGGVYFYHTTTDESVWTEPPEIEDLPVAAGSNDVLLLAYRRAKQEEQERMLALQSASSEATKFEVVTRFEPGEAGPLGFVFQMTTLYDGTSMLRVTKLSGRAAACPHACVDMLLAGIQVAEEARKDVTRMSEEEVLTLVREERRPLTLFFQHPWEVHPDGKGGVYFYHTTTDEPVWKKPPEIEGLPVAAGSTAAAASVSAGRSLSLLIQAGDLTGPEAAETRFDGITSVEQLTVALKQHLGISPEVAICVLYFDEDFQEFSQACIFEDVPDACKIRVIPDPTAVPPSQPVAIVEPEPQLDGKTEIDAILACAQEDGVEWMRSKVMYTGDGRAGKSHLHRNVAGEPPTAPLDSTVGMDTLTLECKAMRTGECAGTWSKYTCEDGVGAAVLALATAGAMAQERGAPTTDTGSMSESVDALLSRPAAQDAASFAAGRGKVLALTEGDFDEAVSPMHAAAAGFEPKPPHTQRPLNPQRVAVELEPELEPELHRELEPEPELPAQSATNLQSDMHSYLRSQSLPESPCPRPQEEMEAAIRMIPGCAKALDSLILEGWDLGGQRIFFTLHHLYMTRFSVFCVLFDMRQLCHDAVSRFPDAFQGVPPGVEVRQYALGVLRFWLNSIVVHTVGADDDSCAPFVLVGTHKDIVHSAQDHAQISAQLQDTFSTHPAWPQLQYNDGLNASALGSGQKTLLWFFPINNLVGTADPMFSEFLATVEKAVRAEDYVHRRVPIAWYRLYDELQKLLVAEHSTVTFAHALELARIVGLPSHPTRTAETELRALLRFLHELGILMYFDEQGLRDVIVLDPQWLIDAATKIICDVTIHSLPEHRIAAKTMQKSWNKLLRKATLNSELLSVLWKTHSEATRVQLLMLMQKFGLIMPQRQQSSFLVPSLLKDSQDSERRIYDTAVAAGALPDAQHAAYFVFSLRAQLDLDEAVDTAQLREFGFLPIGFFPRVLGKCVEWSQCTHGAPPQLTRTSSVLAFGADRFMLNELPDWNAIRLVLLQDNVGVVERVSALIQEVIAECMPHLQCQLMLPSPPPPAATTFAAAAAATNTMYPPAEDGHMLPLELVRVAASTDGSDAGLWTGQHQLTQRQIQDAYSLWLPSVGQLRGYDIMISYRHEARQDTECALKLCDGCGSGDFLFGTRRRNLRVFLDAIRLSIGNRFVDDIMRAMLRSRVVCPVISAAATTRMESIHVGHDTLDWVLVEWILAIELQQLGKVLTIVPILLGEADGGGMRSFYDRDSTGCTPLERLPTVVPGPELLKVRSFLREQGLEPTAELATRTVRETVELLAKEFLAIQAWEWCGDGTIDLHGVSSAIPSSPRPDDGVETTTDAGIFYMFEQCTKAVAAAAQGTLGSGPGQRSEADDDKADAVALATTGRQRSAGPAVVGLSLNCVHHLFLSHKQSNGGPTVAWLEAKFNQRNLLSWYDNAQEDRTLDGMMAGVRDASVFLLFLTDGTTDRRFVQKELRQAFLLRKPFILIEETDDRFGKPDYGKERQPTLHVDDDTGRPILSQEQIDWLFNECTGIPVRRQAHELPGFLNEVVRQTRHACSGDGKRPPPQLSGVAEGVPPQPSPAPAPAPAAAAAAPAPVPAPTPEVAAVASVVLNWSVDQLAQWLTDVMKLPVVATATVEEEIDGAASLQMLREDWMELGGIAGFKAAKIIAGLQKK
eukprot:COSAG01_NODE_55_length_31115_cov_105.202533_2_plen_1797_part_00